MLWLSISYTYTYSDVFEDDDADATITASEVDITISSTNGEANMDINDEHAEDDSVQFGPETHEEWTKKLKTKLNNRFQAINNIGKTSQLYINKVKKDRAIVDVQNIIQLFHTCLLSTCSAKAHVKEYCMAGGILKVEWTCANSHHGCWASSDVLCEKKNQKVYVNTLLLSASILLTGNNFDKIELFCKFLGIDFPSSSTYYRIQRLYVVPECTEFWNDMKNEIWNVLSGEPIILCGDGRNDSPGHSAKYCTYVLMEHFLNVIFDLEVVDQRETGGVSTNMEVFGMRKLLQRIVGKLVVQEIVTDASTAIMALVRKMKGKC